MHPGHNQVARGNIQTAKASRKSIKTSEESNHSSEALGATPGECARAHPPEQKCKRERPVPSQKSVTKPPSEYQHSL
jgi:hypothetical protein